MTGPGPVIQPEVDLNQVTLAVGSGNGGDDNPRHPMSLMATALDEAEHLQETCSFDSDVEAGVVMVVDEIKKKIRARIGG